MLKGHLLLGLLFLLKHNLKGVRGDTSQACNTYECSYDSLPAILGEGEANFVPQRTCYGDHERVNVTCSGDLRGPPYNLCTAGYWLYPFGPTCEDITLCNRTNVPKHGTIHPDEAFFDLYERIYYSCDDKYSLVGPSEAVCESGGVWNPTTVPSCKADCITPVLDNGFVSPDTLTVKNGEVITFECSKNFTKVGLSVTTCRDGNFDPSELPACYADCPTLSETFHNGVRTGDSAPYTHGDEVYYKCDSNFTLVGSTKIICQDSIWSGREPVCKENCWVNQVPNSDCASGYKLSHNETLHITCNSGYSTGVSQATDISCNDGTLSPAEHPECFAQCNRPSIRYSNATSPNPVLHHGDIITVTCEPGYSNGNSQSTASLCSDGMLDPPVPFCYAKCDSPVIPNSDAVSPTTSLHHGDTLNVTCDAGFSNGQSQSSTSVCNDGTFFPPVPLCYAKCRRPIIPNSNSSSSTPLLDHGDALTVTCDVGYSDGKSRATTSTCDDGTFDPPVSLCYHQCNRPVIPDSDATSAYPVLNHGEELTVTCNNGFSNGQSVNITTMCNEGTLIPAVPPCYAQCNQVIIPNSDAASLGPNLQHGDVITLTCNIGFSNGYSDSTTSVCIHGTFIPSLPYCYAECSRPIIPNSDATSSSPSLHHDEQLIVTCNTGYSNWQSQSSTSRCADGELKPDVPLCDAQCNRPVIPNSDSTSSFPVLHNGDTVTVTCYNGYSNGKSKETTSLCNHGILDPAIPSCYAQCSRPVIPNSDATSPHPVLNHGDVITVKCNSGYSNGKSQSSTSICNDGSLNPTVPFCFAKCNRPVIKNSDSSSPYPLLDHGEALTITCDMGYSNGQSRSMVTVCTDGILNPALQFCYAQCSRQVIPNSDSTSSNSVHHGEVLSVTCDEGYSSGQGTSTSSACSQGIFSPPLPTCYAHCSRPVIPNSDAISPNPLVPHGIAITVTCNDGYSNSDTVRTTLMCKDGTLYPDEPTCIKETMESQDVAGVVLGVFGFVLALAALSVEAYLNLWKPRQRTDRNHSINLQDGRTRLHNGSTTYV